ncbi:MAG: 30S ribosome-binding factor RbfA [Chloroflexota bacterium]
MPSRRQHRLNQLLREELAKLLRHETDDPELASVISIVEVDVGPDLQKARAYVSVLGDDAEAQAKLARLRRAAPFFRRTLAERLNLRHTPQIEFLLDTSIARGARVMHLLNTIAKGEPEL